MTGFLKGSATALVTPFTRTGVNFYTLDELIDYQLANGTDALVVLGTTGEPSCMNEREKREVLRRTKARAQGAKVIAGTGSNCTEKAVQDGKRAQDDGADGLLVVTPYYNKCTQNGLIDYYGAICSAVQIPVICYNVPARTGVNLLPETMEKIAELPNVAGLKDACSNMAQSMETLRRIRGKCDLYSGDDALNLPLLCAGGTAVISVVSNLAPKTVKRLTQAALSGNLPEAIALSDALAPLVSACFCEVNPIPVKAGLNLLGFDAGVPRPPLSAIEPAHAEFLKREMEIFLGKVRA